MSNAIKLPDYLIDLIVDYSDLYPKLIAMTKLLSGEQPDFITDTQWSLIKRQHDSLKMYRDVLAERINDAIFNL